MVTTTLRFRFPLATPILFPLLVAACSEAWPEPPEVALEAYTAEHEAWRENRRSGLVASGGPILWVGLWELPQGATAVGSDTTLAVVLPADKSPPLAGTFHRAGQEVRFEPVPGVQVLLADGSPVEAPIVLGSDRSENRTDISLGPLRLRIHGEPGTDRLWLRLWDEEHPARETFQLPASFPADPDWRVPARFEPFDQPRGLQVADVTGGTLEFQAPGELVFQVAGEEYRLLATGDVDDETFFVTFWDETGLSTTYQAGRYIRVPTPDEDGWTLIDFNRAYNPPCVFTPFSVCSLPPPENRLAMVITAGEMRLEH